MMTVSAGLSGDGGSGGERINVNPQQISSAMARLLPVLEKEVERVLEMSPKAASGCLSEKACCS